MKISVIICTRNRFDDFQKTLSSLVSQTRLPDELVIVDSSDEQKIEDYLSSINIPFSTRYFHTQPGLTLQRNYGIRESASDLIFFFDDDVELDSNYFDEVGKVFANDLFYEIGAVGGRIVHPHGGQSKAVRFWLEQKIFYLLRSIFGLVDNGSGRFRWSGMATHPHAILQSRYIECLSGCCMAFRREVFDKVIFDEKLVRYGLMEDSDISKQVLDAGYKIYYHTSATLVHNESPKNRLNYRQWAEMTVVNYDYLFRKSWSKDKWRWAAYYWALLGLIVVNLTKREGLRGTLNGIRNLKGR